MLFDQTDSIIHDICSPRQTKQQHPWRKLFSEAVNVERALRPHVLLNKSGIYFNTGARCALSVGICRVNVTRLCDAPCSSPPLVTINTLRYGLQCSVRRSRVALLTDLQSSRSVVRALLAIALCTCPLLSLPCDMDTIASSTGEPSSATTASPHVGGYSFPLWAAILPNYIGCNHCFARIEGSAVVLTSDARRRCRNTHARSSSCLRVWPSREW